MDLIDTHGKTLQQSAGCRICSLDGSWERLDKPIIEPSGTITTLTVNPAIDRGPDGKYYLIVKGGKPNETRFSRNQAIAVSNTPVGSFKR